MNIETEINDAIAAHKRDGHTTFCGTVEVLSLDADGELAEIVQETIDERGYF